MMNEAKHPLLQFVNKAALACNDQVADDQLLERFLIQRDEQAFAVLVHRHGPMVMGVCRRVLHHSQDAEDAFQATFLVLVRKAGSIVHREKVSSWLYGVAHRTALEARTIRARRKVKEAQVPTRRDASIEDENRRELQAEIDRHLCALPEKYRLPILLCDLQGKTQQEAAKQLGWPEGTVSGRLFRGRQMLAKRLSSQGVTVTAVTLPVLLSQQTWSAAVPISLTLATVKAASACLSQSTLTASDVSFQVLNLVEGVIRAMWMKRIKTVVASIVFLALLATFVGAFAVKMLAGSPVTPTFPNQPPSQAKNPSLEKKPVTADEWFQQMEAKLVNAETVQCKWRSVMGTEIIEIGDLYMQQPNQFRLERLWTYTQQKRQETHKLICDGKQMFAGLFQNGKPVDDLASVDKVRPPLRKNLLICASRPGLMVPFLPIPDAPKGKNPFEAQDAKEVYPVNNFRLGKDIKMGDQTIKVLHYDCEVPALRETFKVTVWMDSDTNLPLKRELGVGNQIVRFITETYSDWVIGGKIDPDRFEVPEVPPRKTPPTVDPNDDLPPAGDDLPPPPTEVDELPK